jgi:exopolysaccharide biosynthesis polyprenyl glycosylphosphotransferase
MTSREDERPESGSHPVSFRRERHRRSFVTRASGWVVAATDLLVLVLATAFLAPRDYPWSSVAFAGGVLVICTLRSQYTSRIVLTISRDASTLAAAVAVPLLAVGAFGGFGRQIRAVLVLGVGALAFLIAGRACAYAGIRRARSRGALSQRLLIVGSGQVAERVARIVEMHPEYGLRPVGFLDDCTSEVPAHPVLGGTAQFDEVLKEQRIDRVVITFGEFQSADLVRVIRGCANAFVDIYVVPRLFELGLEAAPRDVDMVWGMPFVRLRRATLRSTPVRVKRILDASISAALLLITAPVFAVLALCVKCTSPGPILFCQRRIGRHGREVEILKFRSMLENTESDTQWSVDYDPRVTRIGRFLRKTSLDELPQLWNVLRGDMSLVGPRPERPHFVQKFSEEIPGYKDRHRVSVGLTGLAQVNMLRGDTSIEDRAWFDNYYIENWSTTADLAILAQTIGALVKQVRD